MHRAFETVAVQYGNPHSPNSRYRPRLDIQVPVALQRGILVKQGWSIYHSGVR